MKIKFQLKESISTGYNIEELIDFVDNLPIEIAGFDTDNNVLSSELNYNFNRERKKEKIGIIKITDVVFPRKEKLEHIINCEIRIDENFRDELKDINSVFNIDLEHFKATLKRYFICKGKHNYREKYFSRCFWVADCQSEFINQALSSKFYLLENKLREVINEVLTYSLGVDWSSEHTRIYNLTRNATDYVKKVSIFKDIEHDLNMLLTDELADIIMNPGISLSNDANNIETINKVLEEIMSEAFNKNGKIKDEHFRNNVKNSSLFNKEANSLHEDFFAQLDKNGDRMLKNLWDDATKRRNHIAHNKPLDIEFYNKTERQFDQTEALLDEYLTQFSLVERETEIVRIVKEWSSKGEYLSKSAEIEASKEAQKDTSICQIKHIETDPSDELQFESYQELAEEEAGVHIRSDDEIIDFLGEVVDTKIDMLFEIANDLDLIININNSFGDATILLDVKHEMIENKTMVIEVVHQNINSSSGADSEVRIEAKVDGEIYKCCRIKYTNPEYEFNESQSNYMPIISEYLDDNEFNDLIDEIITLLEVDFESLLSLALEKKNSYSTVKDGEMTMLIEEDCPYCGNYETVCTDNDFFTMLGLIWEESKGVCLKCGEECTVGENLEGYLKVVPFGEDPHFYDLHIAD